MHVTYQALRFIFCSHRDWFTLNTSIIVLNLLFGKQIDDADIVLFPHRATNKKVQYRGQARDWPKNRMQNS